MSRSQPHAATHISTFGSPARDVCGSIFAQWATLTLAQSIASTAATPPSIALPTLAERLDRLAAEIERNRVDLRVPGVALAVVQ